MMYQFLLWNFINDSVQAEIPVMLLYVLESNGSSPGRQGFGMAVSKTGDMQGSIGGGIMEHKFVEMAKALLAKGWAGQQQLVRQFHDKEAITDQSGMICSGDQTIFIYQLKKDDQVRVKHIMESLEKYKNGTLLLSPAGIKFSNSIPYKNFSFIKHSETDWEYAEKTGYKNQLFIAGGGHCCFALCKMMQGMDFCINVFEERVALNTLEQNNYAHHKLVIENYSELEEHISPGDNHYVVLMTFGYRTDDAALRALLEKDFKYFGVLGSANKIQKMFSDYIAEGISEERLKKIHAPIGLDINSQTPDEIAISIAAEMIAVKNGKYKITK